MKHIKEYIEFIIEKKPKGAPEFHHSDAPDAEGRFRDLNPKDLAAWLIKTRKKDLKKISGSLTQQVVFNRNDDPAYAEKMEKTRKEVYKQLGREDLLKERLEYAKTRVNGKDIESNWAASTDSEREFIQLIKDLPETLSSVKVPVQTLKFNPSSKEFKGPIRNSDKNQIIKIIKDMTKQFKAEGDPIHTYVIRSYYGMYNLDKHQSDPAYIQFRTKGGDKFADDMRSGKYGSLD